MTDEITTPPVGHYAYPCEICGGRIANDWEEHHEPLHSLDRRLAALEHQAKLAASGRPEVFARPDDLLTHLETDHGIYGPGELRDPLHAHAEAHLIRRQRTEGVPDAGTESPWQRPNPADAGKHCEVCHQTADDEGFCDCRAAGCLPTVADDVSVDDLERQLAAEHEAATFWQTKFEQLERDVASGSASDAYVRQLYSLLDDAAMLLRHADESWGWTGDLHARLTTWRGRYGEVTAVSSNSASQERCQSCGADDHDTEDCPSHVIGGDFS